MDGRLIEQFDKRVTSSGNGLSEGGNGGKRGKSKHSDTNAGKTKLTTKKVNKETQIYRRIYITS